MTLLICPVRPGDSNEELRYAIRSWETNLIMPDLELMVVGYCPVWLKPDHYYTGNIFPSVPFAVWDNVRHGARMAAEGGWDEAIYMNDDFFCLDPTPGVLPVRRNCTLAEHVGQFAPNVSTWWARSLRLTADWLSGQGFTQPWSYEAHRPLLCKPEAMLSALDRWESEHNLASVDMVPQWRTIYGVLNEVEAYPIQDAKLGVHQSGVGTPWISTSDEIWRRYASAMAKRFRKPSRWEIG